MNLGLEASRTEGSNGKKKDGRKRQSSLIGKSLDTLLSSHPFYTKNKGR